jgi:hypothetical protein
MLEKRIRSFVEIASVIILALPLAMYAWIGFYSRYVADDFGTAGYLRTLGFWDAQHYWYFFWQGRYSYTFLVNLVELPGVGTTRWLPMLTLALGVSALYWFWGGAFKLARLPYSRWIRLGAALLIMYATLRMLVNWQQVILWQTGIVTYAAPMIGLTLWSAWFLAWLYRPETRQPGWLALLLTALTFWFLGGFSETSLALQTAVMGFALLLFGLLPAEYPHRRSGSLLLAVGLAGSLAALLCDAASPGNAMKLVHNGGFQLPVLAELVHQTFSFAWHYLKNSFDNALRPMLCILGIPALFAIGFIPIWTTGRTGVSCSCRPVSWSSSHW